jgi:RNA polymerase sigma factor (sigma-70 family)
MARTSPGVVRESEGGALPHETLDSFLSGDAAAFAEVVRVYGYVVRGIARGFWKSPFECEDALQEVWLHVFAQRHAFDRTRLDSFPGWLAVLARRRCIELLRKAGRLPAIATDETDAAERGISDDEPARDLDRRELERHLDAFQSRLRPLWKRFFELHFVEGRDYAEVSRQMRISITRCKYMKRVLASRARKHRGLREVLERGRP